MSVYRWSLMLSNEVWCVCRVCRVCVCSASGEMCQNGYTSEQPTVNRDIHSAGIAVSRLDLL